MAAERDSRRGTAPPDITAPCRHVRLDGCFNFRDLGGYQGAGGRRVRWRRVYRADAPHALTGPDEHALAQLGLHTVIDLRTATEGTARYVDVLPAAAHYEVPMLDVVPSGDELAAWIEPAFVSARYLEMLEAGADAVVEVLAILTDPSAAPALFHCSAGKDRTGILAAVVLSLLGVADEVIVADYTLSAPAMHRFVTWLQATYPDARDRLRRAANALVAAHADAMRGFLASVRAEWGGFEGWTAAHDVASAIPYLQASLLEP
jgi:protein-tyrosine phosphatase